MAATRVSPIDLRSGQGHDNAGVGRRRATLCSHALTVTCRDYKKNFEEEFDQEDQDQRYLGSYLPGSSCKLNPHCCCY
uniref:Uncharacterized protein n=1 Tax=Triticum urartu TaxID=4572 RepID=A0A8R7TMJ7_TRIUA